MDLERMRRLVDEARVGRMATVDEEGRPHVVPIVYAVEGDTLYSSVDQKPKASRNLKRIRNILGNPAVEVVVDRYEEDWGRIWWVRVRGRGEIIERGPERDRALELLRGRYPQYRDMPPEGVVIAVRIDRWRGWSFRPIE